MDVDTNSFALDNLNFIYGNYTFTVCATALKKIIYKVTPITNLPDPDKFYNDIMKSNKFDAIVGLKIGLIVYNKSGYINIDIDNKTYYMILELNVVDHTIFHETLFRDIQSESIYKEFLPKQIGDIKLPVSTEIIRMYIGNNAFQNKYYVLVTISNIDSYHMGGIINNIYENVMVDIDLKLNKLLNETELLTIGFEKQYIAMSAYQSITLVGYLTPRYINGVKVLKLTENSVTIEDSPIWRDTIKNKNSFNIGDIIPYLLNSEQILFTHGKLIKVDQTVIDGTQYVDVKLDTNVLVLGDNVSINELSCLDATIYHYHIITETPMFKIYKANALRSLYKYCVIALHSEDYSQMMEHVKRITKSGKKYIFNVFYANATKIYFTINSTFKFKSIYDFIVHKMIASKFKVVRKFLCSIIF